MTKNGADLGYHTHFVVDGGKARIILQVLVTPSEVMDNQPMRDLLWRVRFHWKLRPRHVTGDTKYGAEDNPVAIEDQGIRAYIPLPDMDHLTEFFSSQEFKYDAGRDVYVCPASQDWHGMRRFRLRRLWRVNREALRIAAGLNLKRLLKMRGWGRRPFPAEAMCAFFFIAAWWLTRTPLTSVAGFLEMASDYRMGKRMCISSC